MIFSMKLCFMRCYNVFHRFSARRAEEVVAKSKPEGIPVDPLIPIEMDIRTKLKSFALLKNP